MRRRVLALALVVLATGLGCGGGDGDRGDVVVIGDSVTDQSDDQILDALDGRDASVIGLSGYRTDQLLPVVEETLGGDVRPAVAVVLAGYNDVWQGRDEEAVVEELVDVMAGVDCAIWVLIPTTGPWDRLRAEELNGRTRAAARAAGVHVETGWQEAVDDGPDGDGPGPDPALVVADQVHPSEAGKQKVAEVVAKAVDRFCG